jgi:hypothetical protein
MTSQIFLAKIATFACKLLLTKGLRDDMSGNLGKMPDFRTFRTHEDYKGVDQHTPFDVSLLLPKFRSDLGE